MILQEAASLREGDLVDWPHPWTGEWLSACVLELESDACILGCHRATWIRARIKVLGFSDKRGRPFLISTEVLRPGVIVRPSDQHSSMIGDTVCLNQRFDNPCIHCGKNAGPYWCSHCGAT